MNDDVAESSLFVGAYGYQTPAGCVDHTIHYYNDSVPNA